jgi:hypothetical protein
MGARVCGADGPCITTPRGEGLKGRRVETRIINKPLAFDRFPGEVAMSLGGTGADNLKVINQISGRPDGRFF